jgi:hypothetical protein
MAWKMEVDKAMPSGILSDHNLIITGTDKGDFYLLDPVSGSIVLHQKFEGSVDFFAADRNGIIWVAENLSGGKGGQIWRIDHPTNTLSLALKSETTFSSLDCIGDICISGDQQGNVIALK